VPFCTCILDQYAPGYTGLISATVRGAMHVLDAGLYQESEPRIEEHAGENARFTDPQERTVAPPWSTMGFAF